MHNVSYFVIIKKYISTNTYKHLLFLDGGLCRIEPSLLICSENQWTGLYMIGTSIMKKLRRSSPIKLRKSVLTSYKAEFAFLSGFHS